MQMHTQGRNEEDDRLNGGLGKEHGERTCQKH